VEHPARLEVRNLFADYAPHRLVAMPWQDRITSTPDVLRGKPRLEGTRIPVSLVLGYLASGASVEDIQAERPEVEPEDVSACLACARDLADYDVAA
jgi:uncharacterized protein (DUF433 family)